MSTDDQNRYLKPNLCILRHHQSVLQLTAVPSKYGSLLYLSPNLTPTATACGSELRLYAKIGAEFKSVDGIKCVRKALGSLPWSGAVKLVPFAAAFASLQPARC